MQTREGLRTLAEALGIRIVVYTFTASAPRSLRNSLPVNDILNVVQFGSKGKILAGAIEGGHITILGFKNDPRMFKSNGGEGFLWLRLTSNRVLRSILR